MSSAINLIRAAALSLVLSAAPVLAFAMMVEGRVIAVADGDTMTVVDASLRQHRVRLAGIDAPESGQPHGQAARRSLGELCFRRKARVFTIDVDRYGRIVGHVHCDGVDANMAQVRSGYAWVYDKQARDPVLTQAQAKARASRLGLWSDPNPIPPWEWRRR